MARVLNIIAKIIELSKEAKKQLEKGKISSTKRIFELILKALKWMRCNTKKDLISRERRFTYYLANFYPMGVSYSPEILYYYKEQADEIKIELVRR